MATMTGSLPWRAAAPLVLSLALYGDNAPFRGAQNQHIWETGRPASKFRSATMLPFGRSQRDGNSVALLNVLIGMLGARRSLAWSTAIFLR